MVSKAALPSSRLSRLSVMHRLALWQVPLILILSLEIGLFMWLFWATSWGLSFVKRWWLQAPILAALTALTAQIVPVRSADFFILMLVILLPFTWRLDDGMQEQDRPSPAGLCPTIFLAGSVFIFQSQFIILLGLVAWLLSFLLWFTTALTGFRLSSISVRWIPILAGSVLTAAVIVFLFTFVPRLSTGFIPSFATASQSIGLTDELSPGGMSDLLASEEVAFRAIPSEIGQKAPDYWRVHVLSNQIGSLWQRADDRSIVNDNFAIDNTSLVSYQIVTDTHDLDHVPMAGWPASSAIASTQGYLLNHFGEARLGEGRDTRQVRITSHHADTDSYDYQSATQLSTANPRLQIYGRELAEQFDNERTLVATLLRQFATEFAYDTTISLPDDDALDVFFFDQKIGFCSYFATTMVTILRAAGIEANVVTGYLGGEWNSFGDYWVVKQADAHAWVEVRYQDGTWQRLDPTLAVMPLTGPRFQGLASVGDREIAGQYLTPEPEKTDFLSRLSQSYAFIDSLNLRVTLAIMNYGADETADNDGASKSEDNFALLLAGVGLAITIIFVIVGVLRIAASGKSSRPAIERQLEGVLTAHIGPRMASDSLTSYVAKSAAWDQNVHDLAASLAASIYQMRFSGDGDMSQDLRHKEALQLVKQQIKQAQKAKRKSQKPKI